MGSKERIQRFKDDSKEKILAAALNIAKNEGWQALSMRKIADQIEYTAPFIYEYFVNKEAILFELTKRGYRILTKEIIEARNKNENADDKLEAMWIAYWDFAFTHRELYRLMYGVDMVCFTSECAMPEVENLYDILSNIIRLYFNEKEVSEERVRIKYYTYWSMIHGLISINLIHLNGRISYELNRQILRDAIQSITQSIKG